LLPLCKSMSCAGTMKRLSVNVACVTRTLLGVIGTWMDQPGLWAREWGWSMQVINKSTERWMREGALWPWRGRRPWRWDMVVWRPAVCVNSCSVQFCVHFVLLWAWGAGAHKMLKKRSQCAHNILWVSQKIVGSNSPNFHLKILDFQVNSYCSRVKPTECSLKFSGSKKFKK
jgi:hypothetical protein